MQHFARRLFSHPTKVAAVPAIASTALPSVTDVPVVVRNPARSVSHPGVAKPPKALSIVFRRKPVAAVDHEYRLREGTAATEAAWPKEFADAMHTIDDGLSLSPTLVFVIPCTSVYDMPIAMVAISSPSLIVARLTRSGAGAVYIETPYIPAAWANPHAFGGNDGKVKFHRLEHVSALLVRLADHVRTLVAAEELAATAPAPAPTL